MAQTIDGFTIDLNRITRREFRDFLARVETAGKSLEGDVLTGDFMERVVIAWPFETLPITRDSYLGMGLEDSVRVDNALARAMENIGQKK